MASENSTAIEAPAASPRKLDNGPAKGLDSNGDLISSADSEVEANGFVENVDKLPPGDVPTAGEESGWLSVSNDGNGSGWISADRAPVDLPPSIVQPATDVPVTKQRHVFYMVRIPRSVDEKLKNDIRLAELKLEQTVKKRDQYRSALQNKRAEKAALIEKLKPIRETERKFRELLQEKRQEMEPVQAALNKFRNTRGKGGICSSEEELNERIAELEYRIQHESIPLKEEKQLLREIKQLEATRSQVCANVELSEKIGSKDEIQDQFKDLWQDADSIKKEQQHVRAEWDSIERDIQKLNDAIEELKKQYEIANTAQQDAFTAVKELKKKENAKNDMFYQNKRDLQSVRELITRKELEGIRSSCSENVEKFMSLWNGDDKFRSEYIKSNERSTVRRLETLDGRSLGPGEKSPQIKDDVIVPATVDVKTVDDELPSKPKTSKTTTEVPKVVEAKESLTEKKAVKDKKEEDDNDVFIPIVTQKPKPVEVADPTEIKEKIRQEQIAKAKEAEERKKKRAERADMKAQARAKKEAERKEKEKERKAQKKTAALVTGATSSVVETTPAEEETEAVVEEPEEKVEEISRKTSSAVSTNNKSQKGSTVNRRKAATREVRPPRPKLPLKKSSPFPAPLWVMVSAAGVLVLFVILALFMLQ